MATSSMEVVERPYGRYVVGVRHAPMLIGSGLQTYTCGTCGTTLVQGDAERSLKRVVFHCPQCSTYSEIASLQEGFS